MNEVEAEAMAIFDRYNKEFIEENFEPVEDKPEYVWFSKRNFQIINISPLAESEDKRNANKDQHTG